MSHIGPRPDLNDPCNEAATLITKLCKATQFWFMNNILVCRKKNGSDRDLKHLLGLGTRRRERRQELAKRGCKIDSDGNGTGRAMVLRRGRVSAFSRPGVA